MPSGCSKTTRPRHTPLIVHLSHPKYALCPLVHFKNDLAGASQINESMIVQQNVYHSIETQYFQHYKVLKQSPANTPQLSLVSLFHRTKQQ